MIHALKILPEFFKAMAAGTKILKDECIKTKEAREYIGKYINIIGIEEI